MVGGSTTYRPGASGPDTAGTPISSRPYWWAISRAEMADVPGVNRNMYWLGVAAGWTPSSAVGIGGLDTVTETGGEDRSISASPALWHAVNRTSVGAKRAIGLRDAIFTKGLRRKCTNPGG